MDPFEPRSRSKRTGYLAPIRVSDHERKIIEWLTTRLSEREGRSVSQADVIRLGLALLFEKERATAELAGDSIPSR